MARTNKAAVTKKAVPFKRTYLKQADVPSASLVDALRVPRAILDHYAGAPTSPFHVCKALNVDPKGSQIRVLTGAAIAFGLVDGGAQAAAINVTDLARRIIRPKSEGDDLAAQREAVLKPRVFGEFLSRYDASPLPRGDIALNVLEDIGVPREKASDVLQRIIESATAVGFIETIKDKQYVSLQGGSSLNSEDTEHGGDEDVSTPLVNSGSQSKPHPQKMVPITSVVSSTGSDMAIAIADDFRRKRVFITHGKNRELVEPIKKLLEYGELEPVVSVERTSVSKPVPEKVMDDMRKCGAAIIHVEVERVIVDQDGANHQLLNPNVLIEVGAAMAFYGRRFILLVKDGTKLPSNLQGLFEVRYSGDSLNADSTIKLLEAIKDIKNYALPTEEPSEI